MTGYSYGNKSTDQEQIFLEISSLNRKTLDLSIQLPEEWMHFSHKIREWVKEKCQRGFITIKIIRKAEPTELSLNSLAHLKKEWDKKAQILGFAQKEVTLAFLREESKHHEIAPSFPLDNSFKSFFDEIFVKFLSMTEKEGEFLKNDLSKRIILLIEFVEFIEQRQPLAQKNFQEKLKEKIEEISLLRETDKPLYIREIVLLVEKSEITEELVRLRSHLTQFQELLETKKSIGRTLDFLAQEMQREANTIQAKSTDLAILQKAISLKTEIERIKEQVQNLE